MFVVSDAQARTLDGTMTVLMFVPKMASSDDVPRTPGFSGIPTRQRQPVATPIEAIPQTL
jgi:hypothetical protein